MFGMLIAASFSWRISVDKERALAQLKAITLCVFIKQFFFVAKY